MSILNYLKILFFFSLIYFIVSSNSLNYNKVPSKSRFYDNILLKKVNESYMLNEYVNINEIESKIPNGRKWGKYKDKQNEINIGIQLESNYVLRVMMTISSIMDSQKPKTKLRFHLAVVLSFSAKDMLKIYSLRRKIREDVEFNFYNAKRVETELKNLNTKGPGAVAKLLLPQLLPDNINRLIIFDTGDLLVLRDLSGMYNLDIKNYLFLGIPGKKVGYYALISKKKYKVYINTGSMLVNVKMYKSENIYKKCVRNKNTYKSGTGDQDLLNDISFGKVGYLPMKFGIRSPYFNDEDSDLPKSKNPFYYFIKYYKSFNPKLIPEEITKVIQLCNNPIVIHQFNGKWMHGKGLTVYRRIAQYYIRLAGIWDEMCIKLPGYCIK
jgi:hypothetical protein